MHVRAFVCRTLSQNLICIHMHRSTPQEDFVEKIDKLFATLDKDGSGELDFSELRNGLKAMKFTPAVIIKEDEYEMLSHHRTLCNRCVCVCVCVAACVHMA